MSLDCFSWYLRSLRDVFDLSHKPHLFLCPERPEPSLQLPPSQSPLRSCAETAAPTAKPLFLGKMLFSTRQMGVSKNKGTPKWMVYNGKPYENG